MLIPLSLSLFLPLPLSQISPQPQTYQDAQCQIPVSGAQIMKMETSSLWSAGYLVTGLSSSTMPSMISISFLKWKSKFPISPSLHGFPHLVPPSKDCSGLEETQGLQLCQAAVSTWKPHCVRSLNPCPPFFPLNLKSSSVFCSSRCWNALIYTQKVEHFFPIMIG